MRSALSLLELVITLAILAALAGIVVPMMGMTRSYADRVATESSLAAVRDAVIQYWSDTKYLPLDGVNTVADESQRFQAHWLFRSPVTDTVATDQFNPVVKLGWHGPYLQEATGSYTVDLSSNFTADYGGTGDPCVLDAFPSNSVPAFRFGHPIVIQSPPTGTDRRDIRIVSAGPNGVIDLPPSTLTEALSEADIGDDLFVAISLQ